MLMVLLDEASFFSILSFSHMDREWTKDLHRTLGLPRRQQKNAYLQCSVTARLADLEAGGIHFKSTFVRNGSEIRQDEFIPVHVVIRRSHDL